MVDGMNLNHQIEFGEHKPTLNPVSRLNSPMVAPKKLPFPTRDRQKIVQAAPVLAHFSAIGFTFSMISDWLAMGTPQLLQECLFFSWSWTTYIIYIYIHNVI